MLTVSSRYNLNDVRCKAVCVIGDLVVNQLRRTPPLHRDFMHLWSICRSDADACFFVG